MIIECPECGTKYTVNDAAIKPRGRTVRCANCATTWHCDGSETALKEWENHPASELEKDMSAATESEFATLPENHTAPVAQQEAPEAEADGNEPREAPVVQENEEMPFVAATPHPRPAARAPVEKQAPAKALSNLVLAASVALIVAVLGLLHARIEHVFPASARLYQIVGLDPKQPGQGLELKDVHAFFDPAIPEKSLSIEATIVNTTKAAIAIPVLHAYLQKPGDKPRQWTFNSDTETLPPQGSTSIKATFNGDGTENGKILLTFSGQNAL